MGVTNEQLRDALTSFRVRLPAKPADWVEHLDKLLGMVVERLEETAEVFNDHGHDVRVQLESDEYESAGDGYAGSPKTSDRGYGFAPRAVIGKGE